MKIKCCTCSKLHNKNITFSMRDFDLDRILQWKASRSLSNRAQCKKCTAKKPVFESRVYTCSECRRELPPRSFRSEQLQELEKQQTLYLATCISCMPTAPKRGERKRDGTHSRWADDGRFMVRCSKCRKEKTEHEFHDKYRSKHIQGQCSTWICISCEHLPAKRQKT